MMAEVSAQRRKNRGEAAETDYLSPIWRRWRVCILLPVALSVVTYLAAGFLPKWYEGRSAVRIAEVAYGGGAINLTGISSRNLETSFTAAEVLETVVSSCKLTEDHDIDAGHLAEDLLDVSSPRATNRIDIRVRMPSPGLAQEVATLVAREGISHFEETMKREYDAMVTKLKAEADQAKSDLDRAATDLEEFQTTHRQEMLTQLVGIHRTLVADREKKILELGTELAVAQAKITAYEKQLEDQNLAAQVEGVLAESPPLKQGLADLENARVAIETFRKTSKIDTLQAEVEVQQELKSQREKDRSSLLAKQAAVKAKVEALRKSLGEEKPTVRLDRKLVKDAAFQQVLAALSGKALQELLALNMTESVVNEVYVALKEELAMAQAQEKGFAGQLAAIDQAAKTGDQKLSTLRERVLARERELEGLKLRQEIARKRVLGAAEAVAQDRGVLTPVYLQAVQKLVGAKTQESGLRAELDVLKGAADEAQKALNTLEVKLFKVDRMLRHKDFQRDQAEEAATKTMAELRAVRNIPRWPPVSLTVTPAPPPTTPASPRRAQIATGVLVVSGLLTWGLVLYLHHRRRR